MNLSGKKLLTILGKAFHRYNWYCETYPWKSPKDKGQRFWDGLVAACRRYTDAKELPQGVLDTLRADPEKYITEKAILADYKSVLIKRGYKV
jgi:hypothetical protein